MCLGDVPVHDLSPGYFSHLSGTTWTARVSALGHLLQVPIEPEPDLWNQTRSEKVWTEGFLRHFLASERRLICHYRSSQCYLHLIQGKDCCEIYWCLAVILICVSWNYSPGMLPHQGHGKMQLPRRTSAVTHGTRGGGGIPPAFRWATFVWQFSVWGLWTTEWCLKNICKCLKWMIKWLRIMRFALMDFSFVCGLTWRFLEVNWAGTGLNALL